MANPKLGRHGIIIEGLDPGGDESLAQAIEADAAARIEALDTIEVKLKEIRTDPGLTYEGKQERIRSYMSGEGAKLAEAATGPGQAAKLRERAESVRAEILDPDHRLEVEDPDSPRTLDAERRVADHLRQLAGSGMEGRQKVISSLREAAENDDRTMLRAVELDPVASLSPILPEEALAEIREVHARTINPEAWEAATSNLRAAGWIEEARRSARETARELSGRAWQPESTGGRVVQATV